MEAFIFTAHVVLPPFVMILIGVGLKKLRFTSGDMLEKLNAFTYKTLISFLIFNSIYQTDLSQAFRPGLLLYGTGCMLGVALVSAFAYNFMLKDNRRRGAMVQSAFRGSYVIFGVALIERVYGSDQLGPAAVGTAIWAVLVNITATLVFIFYDRANHDRVEIKPLVISIYKNQHVRAAVIGGLVALSGVQMPEIIRSPIQDIARCTTPIAFIVLGGQFVFGNMMKNIKLVALGTIVRLAVVPTITLGIAIILGFRGVDLLVLAALNAAPISVTAYPVAANAGGDGELAGHLVMSTTLFSVFSLFAVVYLFSSFGFI